MSHPYVFAVKRLLGLLRPIYHSLVFPTSVIFVAIMVATLFGYQAANVSLRHDIDTAANTKTANLENAITENLNAYEEILRGGVGLFRGSDEVTSEEWKSYINAFDISKKNPGVQGIGFVKVFPAQDLPKIQAFMAEQGITDFTIHPTEPARDMYAPVIFTQIIAAKVPPNYGFDMYSDTIRRAAMLKARNENATTISGRLLLSSADTTTSPVGFNMYTPYYGKRTPPTSLEERQDSLSGFVFASFRAQVFFKDVMKDANVKNLSFSVGVIQDNAVSPLYETASYKKQLKNPSVTTIAKKYTVYGQTWVIRYAINRQNLVSEVQLRRPISVIFFGLFSAVLLSTIVWLLLRVRSRQLIVQKEQAVELAKDELLSLASHQLRTPATGVKQYVGMVLQGFAGKVPSQQRLLLEKAYASNDRQMRIINEILHLAKIDAGRMVLARQPTNINTLVSDAVSEQSQDIKNSEHDLALELPKKSITLNVDAHMLRMAIENLLSNAIKYTPQGGHLKVKLQKDRTSVYIYVRDDGIGIKPNDIDTIFKQFSRLPNAMSLKVEGTGIGLYLAKHLVQLHGGSIQVTSVPKKGSVFTITLPLKDKEQS